MIDKDFLIWLAGFFDGEGCFCIRDRGKKGVEFRMTISQNGERGMEVLHEIEKRLEFGKVYSRGKGSSMWQWELQTKGSVHYVVNLLAPHLRIKQKEAKAFITLLSKWVSEKERPPKEWRP